MYSFCLVVSFLSHNHSFGRNLTPPPARPPPPPPPPGRRRPPQHDDTYMTPYGPPDFVTLGLKTRKVDSNWKRTCSFSVGIQSFISVVARKFSQDSRESVLTRYWVSDANRKCQNGLLFWANCKISHCGFHQRNCSALVNQTLPCAF